MGSATSTSSAHSSAQRLSNETSSNGFNHKSSTKLKQLDIDTTNKIAIVHTNLVAPVIIKNCNEEYQHVSNFDVPIVYGRLSENTVEHPLVQGHYFLCRDVDASDDRLGAYTDLQAPNIRHAAAGFPVYGLGQPTRDALDGLVRKLKEAGTQDIILFNLRAEPVLFVRRDFDMVPYSPRTADRLHDIDAVNSSSSESRPITLKTVSEAEVELRKEVINLASLKDDQKFYFYDNIHSLNGEPHLYRAAYEDDVAVTDEIYCRLTFYSNRVRFTTAT